MSKLVKLVRHDEAVGALLKSDEVAAVCEEIARDRLEASSNYPEGYTIDSQVGQHRVWIRVTATDPIALTDNMTNNTLAKVVG